MNTEKYLEKESWKKTILYFLLMYFGHFPTTFLSWSSHRGNLWPADWTAWFKHNLETVGGAWSLEVFRKRGACIYSLPRLSSETVCPHLCKCNLQQVYQAQLYCFCVDMASIFLFLPHMVCFENLVRWGIIFSLSSLKLLKTVEWKQYVNSKRSQN
jgi:hypothetical protein